MEHIVQFAIGIDDVKIAEICEQKAAEQIIKDVKEYSHGTNYYGKVNATPENLRSLFKEQVAKVVEENKELIIKQAVEELAKNISKQKRVKEAIDEILKE